ncbi:hypothetical protein INF26_01395 [Olsenella sp. DSM 107455]|uniref:Uncharacterized protein n=1 Tax=Thermophilibacter gallinarum TaxID=2779357 RepID=A0ABR9QQZ7_9ACTN|nr:hypothetical protein [Thermophilibacter gallinarum]MBE5023508.1 hypothetical protein [Thermophilibacter gallinarum]
MTLHDDTTAEGAPFATKTLMPLMNTPFAPGTHLQAIEAMTPGAQCDIAQAEYLYFSGQPERARGRSALPRLSGCHRPAFRLPDLRLLKPASRTGT